MKRFRFALLGAVSIAVFTACETATAQTAPVPPNAEADAATPAGVADIVVTAQKRAQSINDVGLSITAATGDQLHSLGVVDTGDLAKITPGFVFTKSINGTPLYTLRGVGFNDYTLGSTPAVTVYVDEVPLTYSVFTRGATLDLERVEVLKGPQGILFGQNSTGGAINYIAAKPTDTFQMGSDGSFGRFATFDGSVFFSGPLADGLSARLALGATESGNWQRSITNPSRTLGGQDLLKGRFQLEWKPSSSVSLLLGANGWRDQSDSQASQLIGLQLQKTVGTGATAAEVNRRIAALQTVPFAPADARAADWTNNLPLRHNDYFYQFSGRADIDLSSQIKLTSITSYARYRERYTVDRDGIAALTDIAIDSNGSINSFNQELRLAGTLGGLQWLVGGNYSHNDATTAISPKTADATNTIIVPGLPITTSTTTVTQNVKEYSGFANVDYEIVRKLTILAGARYTNNKNDATGCTTGDFNYRSTFAAISTGASGSTTPLIQDGQCAALNSAGKPVLAPFPSKLYQDNFSWRAGLNFKPDRDKLFYVTVSKGYKSGSFPVLSAATTAQYAPVTQESVQAYEAGFKLGLFDRTVQLNGAAFHYDYINKQVRNKATVPVFGLLEALVNVPKSRINGAELQLTVVPTSGLTLSAAGTYVDSKVQQFTGINNVGVVANFEGAVLPYSPKWQATGAADYKLPVNDKFGAFVGGNLLYNSEADSTVGANAPGKIKAFTTVDARLGIEATNSKWRLWAFGRNIFNEYYWTNAFLSQDTLVRLAAMPATYGVAFSVKY